MAVSMRYFAVLGLVLTALTGCTMNDVGDERRGVVEESALAPGVDPGTVPGLDAGSAELATAQSASAFPRELAFVDAGRDAECHDGCPARCDDDEICCWSTGFCVPLDCWECCPDNDDGQSIGHSAAEAP